MKWPSLLKIKKLSAKDIETILLKMNQKLKDKGYVTSEVVIPEQNISGGVMTLQCLPGRLGKVVYGKDSGHIPWENAFPIREGDLLNLRMLEEGLEKKAPSSFPPAMTLLWIQIPLQPEKT